MFSVTGAILVALRRYVLFRDVGPCRSQCSLCRKTANFCLRDLCLCPGVLLELDSSAQGSALVLRGPEPMKRQAYTEHLSPTRL